MESSAKMVVMGLLVVAGFAVAVSLLFCSALSGILEPEVCVTLDKLVVSLFGG
jgi:hypothetical protein